VETFGERSDPAILLIMGMAGSMDWWETEFCERLAAGGRYVIRYDLRDTGQSVTYLPGAPEYSARDLVDDALGILDALDVSRAHIVGQSMGAALAQVLALDNPGRVASLTLATTSFADDVERDLPGMAPELGEAFAAPEPDWTEREATLDYLADFSRALASPSHPPDHRALWNHVIERSRNIESSMKNHALIEETSSERTVADLDLPVLVIHGTDDPLFPHEHGVALAREIPGATLLTLEETGHELPRRTWDLVVPAVLELTARGA
jgi:pimeloyl-ACP methyl ester carboxylesterase